MNSIIDYELRPNKYVQRRMLVASISRIIGALNLSYQYVGFGALTFVDFKMFHKELQINHLVSIDGNDEYTLDKLEFNKPFYSIKICKGTSTKVLPDIDLTIPSIVWLDYTDSLQKYMFEDIEIVLQVVPKGSILVITCNRDLKKNKTPLRVADLEEMFEDLVPLGLEGDCCSAVNAPETIKRFFENRCKWCMEQRLPTAEPNVRFHTLYSFIYGDPKRREAAMYTFGGIVLDKDYNANLLNQGELEFVGTEDAYEIKAPNLTNIEEAYLDRNMGNDAEEKSVIDKGIISSDDLGLYKKLYKYLPSFHDVRL